MPGMAFNSSPSVTADCLTPPATEIASSNGRGPVWLVPVKGSGTVDGEHLEPGGVWVASGATPLALDDGADILVAYAKEGVIGGLWG